MKFEDIKWKKGDRIQDNKGDWWRFVEDDSVDENYPMWFANAARRHRRFSRKGWPLLGCDCEDDESKLQLLPETYQPVNAEKETKMNKKILESLPKIEGIEWVMREMWVWDDNVESANQGFVTHKWIDQEEDPFVTLTGSTWQNASDTDPRNAIKPGDLVVRFYRGEAREIGVAHHKNLDDMWFTETHRDLGYEQPIAGDHAVKASPELVACLERMREELEEGKE